MTIFTMIAVLLLSLNLLLTISLSSIDAHHFSLHRRGGRFVRHEPANLTRLFHALHHTEDRYYRTIRLIQDNRVLRKWSLGEEEKAMLDGFVLEGSWYITIDVGDPAQSLEFEIDLLNPDFYTLLTTSDGGSKFNTFASNTHTPSNHFIHPLCQLPSDNFHLSNLDKSTKLDWPICQPSKSSRHTLSNSGSVLGLAPNSQGKSSSLSQLTAPTFIRQLQQNKIIPSSLWSITLFNGDSGIFTIGGSLVAEFEEAKARTEAQLKYMGHEDASMLVEEEVKGRMTFAMPAGSSLEDHFKWTDVSGAGGWWTGLMNGVWVDGVKILKNQPFLIDLSCPFIIAPPTAFKHFYNSISGSKPLQTSCVSDQSNQDLKNTVQKTFHLFPCLNPPKILLELAGWPFPLTSTSQLTREDVLHGPSGGPFSLGKVEEFFNMTADMRDGFTSGAGSVSSGFCVGIVVQSDMGERDEEHWRTSGMRDTWVLGEPFFRGTGILFDDGGANADGKARIGFRSY